MAIITLTSRGSKANGMFLPIKILAHMMSFYPMMFQFTYQYTEGEKTWDNTGPHWEDDFGFRSVEALLKIQYNREII